MRVATGGPPMTMGDVFGIRYLEAIGHKNVFRFRREAATRRLCGAERGRAGSERWTKRLQLGTPALRSAKPPRRGFTMASPGRHSSWPLTRPVAPGRTAA